MSVKIEELKGKWLASNPDYTFNIMLEVLEDFEGRIRRLEEDIYEINKEVAK